MKVTCDNCSRSFKARPKERALDSGGLVSFLRCPKCKAEYPSHWITAKGVAIRSQLAKMRKAGRTDTDTYRKAMRDFQEHVHRGKPPMED